MFDPVTRPIIGTPQIDTPGDPSPRIEHVPVGRGCLVREKLGVPAWTVVMHGASIEQKFD